MPHSPSSLQRTQHDPVAAIARSQTAQPRFRPGILGWWQALVTYVTTGWVGTRVARQELDVELTRPGRPDAIAVPAPQVWEDPNAIVLDEVASIFRGWLAVPGKLTLNSRELSFVERGSKAPSPSMLLSDIECAERSAHTNAFNVSLRDGSNHRLVVFDRDNWIVQINVRISAFRVSG